MPKLKRRKDGGYFIHMSGDVNSINTFQVTDRGAEIVKSSGKELGEYFPDHLFYLLYDLGHISTKGKNPSQTKLPDLDSENWEFEDLSVADRVQVALQVIESHGVLSLFKGKAANWIISLIGESSVELRPLIKEISEAAGYSYETIQEYSESVHDGKYTLEIALCGYLQHVWLRDSAPFDLEAENIDQREVVWADDSHVHIRLADTDESDFTIPGDTPEPISDELDDELGIVWMTAVASAGFMVYPRIEMDHRHGFKNGVVLPRSRLKDFPVHLPQHSEIIEVFEALRLLEESVEQVLASSKSSVSQGDKSPCDRWRNKISQQIRRMHREDFFKAPEDQLQNTIQKHRYCYGNGEKITDFEYIEMGQPDESQSLLLFGLGIFSPGEERNVPFEPSTGTPLPIYPQSENEFENAVKQIDRFCSKTLPTSNPERT
ncbi:hypothetical protein [Halogeometricum sp. CBA1124]|uniref:hypothetical protein n=1 Tax=Halogeometricum sp. CBA1124 TaxID=2668071 RepID=UPI001428DE0A|nr:hypothetical protein [Halogeometricum sp. CBA1124]MUV56104.1 hypothetical protein [Halogeometricum sp. CBA1124]